MFAFYLVSRFVSFRSPRLSCSMSHAMNSRILTIRNVSEEDYLDLSLMYENSTWGLTEKRFNFRRRKEEPLRATFCRMSSNILTAIEKKFKSKKKKAKSDVPTPVELPTVSISLHCHGLCLEEDVRNVDAWKDGAVLRIDDTEYTVCVNAPMVKSIKLPKSIMIGFPVYPKVELEFASTESSIFTWYLLRHDQPFSLQRDVKPVGHDFFYTVQTSDLGRKLKVVCVPQRDLQIGLEASAIADGVVEAGPGPCPFEERHSFTRELTQPGSFRCVSYNILADLYADSDFTRTVLFPYCPSYALEVDYRKQLYLKEISGYNADIICLQEVDTKVYFNDLLPYLKFFGLEGAFIEKGGQVVEGLACFYRSTKFRIRDVSSIVFAEVLASDPIFTDIYEAIKKNEKLLERVLKRTTAVQTLLLECVEDKGQMILVGNTHLYYRPDADHIRLLQAAMVLRYMEKQITLHQQQYPDKSISPLLCGDFNSCPEFAVFKFMTTGFIPEDLEDWKSNEEEAVQGLTLSHLFHLDSACGCPPYTNFTPGFFGCLDYIFYDTSRLQVQEVVPLPSHEQVTQHTALPSIIFPSDHLALVCVLQWKKQQTTSGVAP